MKFSKMSEYSVKMEEEYRSLLRHLKSVVECLLMTGTTNFLDVYGGLNRLQSAVEKIFQHGCKARVEDGIIDFEHIIHCLATSSVANQSFHLQSLTSRSSLSSAVSTSYKFSLFLHHTLQSHSLSQLLTNFLMNLPFLNSCYTSYAFLRQEGYASATVKCLRAVERHEPILLSELDPFLCIGSLGTSDEKKLGHRRCSSYPEERMRRRNRRRREADKKLERDESKKNNLQDLTLQKLTVPQPHLHNSLPALYPNDSSKTENKHLKPPAENKIETVSMPNTPYKSNILTDHCKNYMEKSENLTEESYKTKSLKKIEEKCDTLEKNDNLNMFLLADVNADNRESKEEIVSENNEIKTACKVFDNDLQKEKTNLTQETEEVIEDISNSSKNEENLTKKSSKCATEQTRISDENKIETNQISLTETTKENIKKGGDFSTPFQHEKIINDTAVVKKNQKGFNDFGQDNAHVYIPFAQVKKHSKSFNSDEKRCKKKRRDLLRGCRKYKQQIDEKERKCTIVASPHSLPPQHSTPRRSLLDRSVPLSLPVSIGHVPRPSHNQSLASFLSAGEFSQTGGDLDRENAHFNVSETIIAVIEQLKWVRERDRTFGKKWNPDNTEGKEVKQLVKLQKSLEAGDKIWSLKSDEEISSKLDQPEMTSSKEFTDPVLKHCDSSKETDKNKTLKVDEKCEPKTGNNSSRNQHFWESDEDIKTKNWEQQSKYWKRDEKNISNDEQRIRIRKRWRRRDRREWRFDEHNRRTPETSSSRSHSSSPTSLTSSSASSTCSYTYTDLSPYYENGSRLSASLASLYSANELQPRGTPDGQDATPDLTNSSVQGTTAEGVALSLIRKFSEKQLPKASDLDWLVSERDAPQQLLPLPRTWSQGLSNKEANEQCIQLRGTNDWAPPRPQLIFTLHPQSRTQQQNADNGRCAGCGEHNTSRNYYCEYLGRYFCSACHRGGKRKTFIPARIIQKWDFSRYAVSEFSYRLLEQMFEDPLFRVIELNPNLLKKSRNLERCEMLRQRLYHIKDFIYSCRYATEEQLFLRQEPAYIISDLGSYSLKDLLEVKRGDLEKRLGKILDLCKVHTERCQLCLARGHVCEICHNKDTLFPWDATVQVCTGCGACTHKHCLLNVSTTSETSKYGNCARCLRIAQRDLCRQKIANASTKSDVED